MSKKLVFSNSYLESIEGIDYLNLSEDTPYKTGFAAGTLFGMADYKIIRLLKNPFVGMILKFLYFKYGSRIKKMQFPPEYTEEFRGYSDATGIPSKYLHLGNLLYEVRGCSSFAFINPDGSMLVGHNTDAAKLFAKIILHYTKPLVTSMTVPGKNKFVHISFPFFIGAINGFNEKGVAISSHEIGNIYSKANDNNMSTACFLRMVLEKTETRNDILKMALSNPTCLPVNVLIASKEEQKFALLELYYSEANLSISSSRPFLGVTNHYQSKIMERHHKGVRRGSLDRWKCFEQILSTKSSLSIQEAVSTLKDHRNGLRRDISGYSLTNIGTYQSFVFDLARSDLYIANGRELPVSLSGNFVRISTT